MQETFFDRQLALRANHGNVRNVELIYERDAQA